MTRTEIESSLIALIRQSDLAQDLRTIDFYDDSKFNKDSQILLVPPAVLIWAGPEDFKQASDLYGISYDDRDFYFVLLVAAKNYRSPEARRQGDAASIGVNEIVARLTDLLRGVNLATGDRSPGEPRIFLERVDPEPDFQGACFYSLTLRVAGVLQPI